MANTIQDKLFELKIEPESELGKALIKLDSVYAQQERVLKQIRYLKDKHRQLREDAELMEMLLMHKFNKDSRVMKWASKKY